MFSNILIVCEGNICRSPMAEMLLKERVKLNRAPVKITSAGLFALCGHPADPKVQEILLEEGIDCSSHRAIQLTQKMLLNADLVLVMEQQQCKKIKCDLPSVCGKVHLLGKWGNFEIPDPYRQTKEVFKNTFSLIQEAIDDWRQRLWK